MKYITKGHFLLPEGLREPFHQGGFDRSSEGADGTPTGGWLFRRFYRKRLPLLDRKSAPLATRGALPAHTQNSVPMAVAQTIRSRLLGQTQLPAALTADIASLSNIQFNRDYSEYAVGNWASLAVFNRDGDADSSQSYEYIGSGRWTKHGDSLPLIKKIAIQRFKTDAMRSARIFVARDGGFIRPHRDYAEFEKGFTRLHLVLQTNQLAMNGEGRKAYHMAAGSIWYLEGREPHWAANFAKEARYHLVCDFPATMAPEECIRQDLGGGGEIQWCARPPLTEDVANLVRVAARSVSSESVPELLDLADRMFVTYQCEVNTPYDLVIPHLGDRVTCIQQAISRRTYFLGF